MTELSFKLSKPIKVSKDGGFEEVYELVLTAPSMKDRKQAANLSQFIARAQAYQEQKFIGLMGLDTLQSLADDAKSKGQAEIEVGEDSPYQDIKSLITSSNEDLEDFYKCFETLMLRACTVLTDVEIRPAHIEQLALKDFENVCFEYCENFIK